MIFANELTHDAKKSLVALMIKMSLVDGVVESETALINQMSTSLGLNVDDVYLLANENTIESLCEIFIDRKSKVTLLIDLVNIACIDDDYTQSERSQIKEVCGFINISDSLFERIEEWVQSGISWKKKGLEIFEEE